MTEMQHEPFNPYIADRIDSPNKIVRTPTGIYFYIDKRYSFIKSIGESRLRAFTRRRGKLRRRHFRRGHDKREYVRDKEDTGRAEQHWQRIQSVSRDPDHASLLSR